MKTLSLSLSLSRITLWAATTLGFAALTAGCGHDSPTFSFLPASQSFSQNAVTVNNELDILWVVDNSASMTPLQTNMVDNFSSFISNFQTKGYDFRMTVTTTDAYKANKSFVGYNSGNSSMSLFQDGAPGVSPTGVFVIIPSTPNLDNVFVTNATTGNEGSGDERAFSSMMTTLQNASNPAFLRPTSFFAIIILSDEDDFSNYNRTEMSWGGNDALDHCYVNSAMDTIATTAYSGPNHVSQCSHQTPPDTVQSYETALDQLTQTTGASRRYNVNTIAVLDSTCQQQHMGTDPNGVNYVTVEGQRYMQMSSDTNGIEGSICDTSYATSLANIATNIAELSTQFFLNRTPQISTIVVQVNGNTVAEDPNNGWTYNSAANSIVFHGTAIPAQGATVNVYFEPTGVL